MRALETFPRNAIHKPASAVLGGGRPLVLLAAFVLALFPAALAAQTLTPIAVLTDGVDGIDGLADNRWVESSPDGRHVYVAGQGDNAIALFARDPASGVLSPVEVLFNGVGGVTGIAGVSVDATNEGQYVNLNVTVPVLLWAADLAGWPPGVSRPNCSSRKRYS